MPWWLRIRVGPGGLGRWLSEPALWWTFWDLGGLGLRDGRDGGHKEWDLGDVSRSMATALRGAGGTWGTSAVGLGGRPGRSCVGCAREDPPWEAAVLGEGEACGRARRFRGENAWRSRFSRLVSGISCRAGRSGRRGRQHGHREGHTLREPVRCRPLEGVI